MGYETQDKGISSHL